MKKILLVLMVQTATLTHGQVDLDKFDEIILVDFQNWRYNKFYRRTYLIKLIERPVKLNKLKILTGVELLDQLKE